MFGRKHGRRVKTLDVTPGRALRVAGVLVACGGGALPEVATDVIDPAANYAVRNVKRDRSNFGFGAGLGRLLEHVLGSRAARL
ncbi:MAG: hypothetical protein N3B01_00140 [Verrucomicrobiae bacterium]|nr:hypothetical protein [Verrucomicrobiae bacterium]